MFGESVADYYVLDQWAGDRAVVARVAGFKWALQGSQQLGSHPRAHTIIGWRSRAHGRLRTGCAGVCGLKERPRRSRAQGRALSPGSEPSCSVDAVFWTTFCRDLCDLYRCEFVLHFHTWSVPRWNSGVIRSTPPRALVTQCDITRHSIQPLKQETMGCVERVDHGCSQKAVSTRTANNVSCLVPMSI